jgi:hypothetical protein
MNQDEITELTSQTTQLIKTTQIEPNKINQITQITEIKQAKFDQSTRHVDNVLSISMALLGVFTTFSQTYEKEVVVLFILYYLNDIRKTTKDFVIHHILSTTVCICGYYLKSNQLPLDQFRQMVLYMELSAPLYTLSLYIKHPLTDLLFTGWFIYCRIYKQYYLLNDPATYNEIGLGCIPYCFLFGLNLYWIFRGLKRLFKPFKDPVYKLYCHKIIPFVRPFKLSLINFYSTCANYLYHELMYNKIYNQIHNETSQIEPQEIIYDIINSIVSVASIEPCYYQYSIPIHMIKFIFELDEAIPIGVDMMFYFSSDAVIVYYLYLLFRQLNAFYNMTPLITHIMLLWLRSFSKV